MEDGSRGFRPFHNGVFLGGGGGGGWRQRWSHLAAVFCKVEAVRMKVGVLFIDLQWRNVRLHWFHVFACCVFTQMDQQGRQKETSNM